MASRRNNISKVTIRDVSKLAKVSMATVSRVLNRPDIVSPDKVKRVQEAVRFLDYRPNFFARGIKTRVSEAIAFVYPTDREHIVSNPLYSKIFEEVEIGVQKHQFSLVFIGQRQSNYSKEFLSNFIKARRVDGFIFTCLFDSEVLRLIPEEMPLVLIDPFDWHSKNNLIVADNFHGATQATDELVKLGHRRILFFSGTYDGKLSWSFRERFMGFRETLQNHKIKFDESMYYTMELGTSRLSIEEVAHNNLLSLLKKDFTYTAIIAATDRIAIGAMAAIKEKGLDIPEQISIIGFEGIDASAQTEPPLTTVKIDFRQMGALGVRRILDIIKQKGQMDTSCIMSVPTELVIRGSTGPCKKRG